ncbi:bifunctional 6-phosphofructo-2-kinase fructose-2,6-bisphosphate 2-phosphatase [Amanita rubescens]|nr:bifunctional 6-phosphofructo-2-kinase fructose-2,6-bisphosphate 2-phosphatase [Amanita rubescens]
MVAPLYTTDSGLLFHAGKILILTVGLPARGKTHISRALERYLRWMGVKTQVVSLGDYRRKTLGGAQKLPSDYFTLGQKSPETLQLRKTVADGCEKLIWNFFDGGGQVVIYDANNGSRASRQSIAEKFDKKKIHVIYLETICDNKEIIETNIRNVKISSPDYRGWDPDAAVKDYYRRINDHEKFYQTVEETEWPFIKIINVGEKIEVNNIQGYLQSRIVFFLMNIHNRYRTIYFARSGQSLLEHSYKADSDLSPVGWDYAEKLAEFVLERRAKNLEARGIDPAEGRLVIWTSTRRRAHHTAWPFLAAAQASLGSTTASTTISTPAEPPMPAPTLTLPPRRPNLVSISTAPAHPSPLGRSAIASPTPSHGVFSSLSSAASMTSLSHPTTPPSPFSSPPLPPLASANPAMVASPLLKVKVVEKPQMLEINPGIWDGLTPNLAKKYYPGDWKRFVKDPYSYRVPRAESYHDLSIRLEPVLIELEREKEDLLIIGHASVIRCLLAYLIGLPASEIPAIEVARGDLLEVVPTSYGVVSQAHHFWDGPGRIEEEVSECGVESEHTEDEEVSPEGVVHKVKKVRQVYRDVNNFYENYAEDTKGKRVQLASAVMGDGKVGIAKTEMDTVLRAVGGISVKGSEVKKDPEVSEHVSMDT